MTFTICSFFFFVEMVEQLLRRVKLTSKLRAIREVVDTVPSRLIMNDEIIIKLLMLL